jgi:hypothetical protein
MLDARRTNGRRKNRTGKKEAEAEKKWKESHKCDQNESGKFDAKREDSAESGN